MNWLPKILLALFAFGLHSDDNEVTRAADRFKEKLSELKLKAVELKEEIEEQYNLHLQPFVRPIGLKLALALIVLSSVPLLSLGLGGVTTGQAGLIGAQASLAVGILCSLYALLQVFRNDHKFSLFSLLPRLFWGFVLTGVTTGIAAQYAGSRLWAVTAAATLLIGVGIAYGYTRLLAKLGVVIVTTGERAMNAVQQILASMATGKLADKLADVDWDIASQEDFAPAVDTAFSSLVSLLLPIINISIIVQQPAIMVGFLFFYLCMTCAMTILLTRKNKRDRIEQMADRSAEVLYWVNLAFGGYALLSAMLPAVTAPVNELFAQVGNLLIGSVVFATALLKGQIGLPLIPLWSALIGLVITLIAASVVAPKDGKSIVSRVRQIMAVAFGAFSLYCLICVICGAMSWKQNKTFSSGWNLDKDMLTLTGLKNGNELGVTTNVSSYAPSSTTPPVVIHLSNNASESSSNATTPMLHVARSTSAQLVGPSAPTSGMDEYWSVICQDYPDQAHCKQQKVD